MLGTAPSNTYTSDYYEELTLFVVKSNNNKATSSTTDYQLIYYMSDNTNYKAPLFTDFYGFKYASYMRDT